MRTPLRRLLVPISRFTLGNTRTFHHGSCLFKERVEHAGEMSSLNVLADVPDPQSSITKCTPRGFHMFSGQKVENGDAVLIVDDHVYHWRPWEHSKFGGVKKVFTALGQLDLPGEVFAALEKGDEKPDLLIIGCGPSVAPVTPEMRESLTKLGMRFDILDSRNAAAQYNLLATERGTNVIAAALLPMGWKDGVGVPEK